MTEHQAISLKEFMTANQPSSGHGLAFFRGDIVTLYAAGYSLKSIFDYVKANGYRTSYSTMCRWISKNMNLEQEAIEFRKNGGEIVSPRETVTASTDRQTD